MTIRPGEMAPLGATADGNGVNFAVHSEPAERVELCLFDPEGGETRHTLPGVASSVHHGYVPGLEPGQSYGYRVHGRWAPSEGILCNPAKLLLDPYAMAVTGAIDWGPELYGSLPDDADAPDPRDSARHMPKAVVVDPTFDWGNDRPPDHPLHDSVVYETHVRGMTIRHPEVPDHLRGTYAGMVCPPVLEHLTALGITAVELLPVHHFASEHPVVKRGLTNYWGYSPLAYLAPHGAYSSQGDAGWQVHEFKSMVRAFHEAGIEVILDVVYNHTVEGNHLGPLLSLKGFDNPGYYRLDPDDPRRYVDVTGTGNSVDMGHPPALRLVMDSLRHWVLEMHVDGFRFDLAAALGRGPHGFDHGSSLFDAIRRDEVISRVKLIAEPWDLGEGGYQVGNFPSGWSEWNGRYRDDVRDFWRNAGGTVADFASRLAGSSDLYASSGRDPSAGVNFITAHDGFTLADLVAYDHKHNEANGEGGRDGDDHNRSWNSGAEGPTTDAGVIGVRSVRRRSMLATLLLSQGVPMLLGGDEIGRTQGGNNNGYAQDNKVSWLDWDRVDRGLLAFVRRLVRFRSDHPVFRRRLWFEGESIDDIAWYTPGGSEMVDEDWEAGGGSLAVFLDGEALGDDSFLLLFNARPEATTFVVPEGLGGTGWLVDFDTSVDPDSEAGAAGNGRWEAGPWATVVMRRQGDRH
jgi:glycogen operon protein